MNTRLLIVDDQPEFRFGLRALVSTITGVTLVGEAGDGAAAIAACEEHAPDVVLMDLRMPCLDGIAATREIARRMPRVHVLVLTTFHDDDLVRDAIAAGASGYVLKDTPADDLGELIRVTHKGYAAFAPGLRLDAASERASADPSVVAKIASLTERERTILRAIATGATNRDIARELFITEGTVKNYVTSVLARLAVRSRTEAAILARHLA